MPTIEELKIELQKSDDAVRSSMGEMKKELDLQKKALDEMKAKGERPETPPEIAKAIDRIDASITDGNTKMAQIQAEVLKSIEGSLELGKTAQGRLDELEKALQRPGNQLGGEPFKSAGQMIEELIKGNESAFQQFAGKGSRSQSLPMVNLKSFEGQPAFSGLAPNEIQKALSSPMTTGVNPASNFIPVQQLPGFIPMARRRLRMRDLIPIVQTTNPAIRYLRQTGFTSVLTSAVTSITRSGSTVTVTQTGHGYQDFDFIKIAGADQAGYNSSWRIKVTGANTYTFDVGAATPVTPATGTLVAKRMNNFGAAAFVTELNTKPETEMSFEERILVCQVIAHYIKSSRQVLDDLPGLRSSVDNQLLYGLLFREDAAFLYGTGVAPQIPGIMLDPDAQQYAWSQGSPGDSKVDAIRRSRTLVELALYEASGAVVHPKTWEEIELERGTDGHYLWVQSPAGMNPGGEALWRIPLVVTPMISSDQFLVGAFGAGATIYDREQANIRFSDQNEADFINNRVTILAEERVGVAWKLPEAFVVGSFDEAPAPLEP